MFLHNIILNDFAGGFEKVTWDGASDTYPSQCVMYQLTHEEAITLVHEAHERGACVTSLPVPNIKKQHISI